MICLLHFCELFIPCISQLSELKTSQLFFSWSVIFYTY